MNRRETEGLSGVELPQNHVISFNLRKGAESSAKIE